MRRMDVARKGWDAALVGAGDEGLSLAYRGAMQWLRFGILLLPLQIPDF